jgi:hypothetical protein
MEQFSFTISKSSVISQKLVNPQSVLNYREEKSSDSNAVNFMIALLDIAYDEIKDFLENNNTLFLKDLFLLEGNEVICNTSKIKSSFQNDSNDLLEPYGKGNIVTALMNKLNFSLMTVSKTKQSIVVLLNK